MLLYTYHNAIYLIASYFWLRGNLDAHHYVFSNSTFVVYYLYVFHRISPAQNEIYLDDLKSTPQNSSSEAQTESRIDMSALLW